MQVAKLTKADLACKLTWIPSDTVDSTHSFSYFSNLKPFRQIASIASSLASRVRFVYYGLSGLTRCHNCLPDNETDGSSHWLLNGLGSGTEEVEATFSLPDTMLFPPRQHVGNRTMPTSAFAGGSLFFCTTTLRCVPFLVCRAY